MRVLLFSDFGHRAAVPILQTVLREIARRDGWRLVGLCDGGAVSRMSDGRGVLAARVHRSLNDRSSPRRVGALAARNGVPVLGAAATSINDPEFISEIAGADADLALCFACLQIWERELLDVVKRPVNYHDGLLPAYAGLAATQFSLYRCESESGFTYHEMTTGIDAGPIVFQGSVPVHRRDSLEDVVARKREAFLGALPEVLDRVGTGTPGRPQVGRRTYFSAADRRRIVTIDDPSTITAAEFEHRLRCFGGLSVLVSGRREHVTAVSSRRGLTRPHLDLADAERYISEISGHRAFPYRATRRLVGRRFVARLS